MAAAKNKQREIPFVVNFFNSREYEDYGSLIEAQANTLSTDPKSFGSGR